MLYLNGIYKSFGPVKALRGVDMDVRPGEVHALIGENGAGKSTLMKVLSGVFRPDSGSIRLDGEPFEPESPLASRQAGISMIYQELTLAPHLTVEENVTLGIERTAWGRIVSQADRIRELLSELGQEQIRTTTRVGDLSVGKQQIVEVVRALFTDARILVMDEPTSSLSAEDTASLFAFIRRLRARGVAIIYISHFLEEVHALCDRYTVLRDGETVATGTVSGVSSEELVQHMIGREVDELYPGPTESVGEPLFEVAGVSGAGQPPVSAAFTLHEGEIMGMAGLVGAGRSETLRTLFGLERASSGTIQIPGQSALDVRYLSPATALEAGIDFLSENRKEEGLALNLTITMNLTLSALRRYASFGVLNKEAERRHGDRWLDVVQVKRHASRQPAATLSGGNQQKVCLARLLHQDNDILLLDEPTRGIDIGSKADIYGLIRQLAQQGKAIVLVSSYLPELLGMCHSLTVMHRGVLSEKRPISAWSEHTIMQYATMGGAS